MVGVLYLSLNPREKTSILCIYIFTVATSFNLYISAVFSLSFLFAYINDSHFLPSGSPVLGMKFIKF